MRKLWNCSAFIGFPKNASLSDVLRNWREDSLNFVNHDLPRIFLIAAVTYALIWILRAGARRVSTIWIRRLPSTLRAQKVQTLAVVVTNVGISLILFVAITMALSVVGFNPGPLLASAGIAGLAIGFGAQTLVHDMINGFLILLEDQFEIGDTIRIATVKGTVEAMSLRRTVLRDEDGTLHMVPNSQITLVSNMTRDWAQLTLRISVAYSESSERVVSLLKQVGEELRHDPELESDLVADIQVPGIDRVDHGEAEYLMLVKTRPGKQYEIRRELRRRIKECFEKNKVQPGNPSRVYVLSQGPEAKAS